MPLRPMTEGDLMMVLAWRNSPNVRAAMYHSHLISEDEHRAWFARIKDDCSSVWLIFENGDGSSCGVGYFTQINQAAGTALWGFYAAPEAGKGTGTRLGEALLSYAFNELKLRKVNAEVISSNNISLKFHRKLGFNQEGRFSAEYFNGQSYEDIHRFAMNRRQWAELYSRTDDYTHPESDGVPLYIFASSRLIYRSVYDDLRQKNRGRWLWVSDSEELAAAVDGGRPDYIFFAHWNWIVDDVILSAAECICFHMTDVPYGRGGSPLQNLIVRGHTETKLTALKMTPELDAGPVYSKHDLSLSGSASDILGRCADLVGEAVEDIIRRRPAPVPQQGKPEIFKRRKPEQSELPPEASLPAYYDHIRMLDATGYPPAYILYGNFEICFKQAELENGELSAKAFFIPCNRSTPS